MTEQKTKACTKCGEVKPITDYYREKRALDGKTSDCKECIKARTREYNRLNKERLRPRKREAARSRYAANRERNRDRDREYAREYREKNRDAINARNRERYAANVEAERRKAREYRAANKERVREWKRNYTASGKARDVTAKWRRENPGLVRQLDRKYKAKSPEKYVARSAVGNALRSGRLVRQPCERCGATERVEAHHEDYSRPLDVNWLCKDCHAQRHIERREQERADA